MNILRGESGNAADHHLATLFVPLQNRPRSDAELLAHVRGNRNLALRGDLGTSDRQASYYHGNASSLLLTLNLDMPFFDGLFEGFEIGLGDGGVLEGVVDE